ncbi:MAG: hypothetical protein QE271_13350 [Bacteriovoracaceae bacterium]|nr:hypothetical protein [Bacteriovoracaceae bacterium]
MITLDNDYCLRKVIYWYFFILIYSLMPSMSYALSYSCPYLEKDDKTGSSRELKKTLVTDLSNKITDLKTKIDENKKCGISTDVVTQLSRSQTVIENISKNITNSQYINTNLISLKGSPLNCFDDEASYHDLLRLQLRDANTYDFFPLEGEYGNKIKEEYQLQNCNNIQLISYDRSSSQPNSYSNDLEYCIASVINSGVVTKSWKQIDCYPPKSESQARQQQIEIKDQTNQALAASLNQAYEISRNLITSTLGNKDNNLLNANCSDVKKAISDVAGGLLKIGSAASFFYAPGVVQVATSLIINPLAQFTNWIMYQRNDLKKLEKYEAIKASLEMEGGEDRDSFETATCTLNSAQVLACTTAHQCKFDYSNTTNSVTDGSCMSNLNSCIYGDKEEGQKPVDQFEFEGQYRNFFNLLTADINKSNNKICDGIRAEMLSGDISLGIQDSCYSIINFIKDKIYPVFSNVGSESPFYSEKDGVTTDLLVDQFKFYYREKVLNVLKPLIESESEMRKKLPTNKTKLKFGFYNAAMKDSVALWVKNWPQIIDTVFPSYISVMNELLRKYKSENATDEKIKILIFKNSQTFQKFQSNLPLVTTRVDPNPNNKNVISDRFENLDGIFDAMMKRKGYFTGLLDKEVNRRLDDLRKDAKIIIEASKSTKENAVDSRRLLFIDSLYQVFRDCILAFQMGLEINEDGSTYALDDNFALLCKPIIGCNNISTLLPSNDFYNSKQGFTPHEKLLPMCKSITYMKENLTKLENEFSKDGKICGKFPQTWLTSISK